MSRVWPTSSYRYELYYVPDFPLANLGEQHQRKGPDSVLQAFVDDIQEHIAKYGIRNPVGVQIRRGRWEVRPGKCRVTAAIRNGWETIPAIVIDYDKGKRPKEWEPLPYDAKYITSKYLTGDCVFELERRFANVKKNVDVVQRPGVENAFRRELRLAAKAEKPPESNPED